MKPQLIMDPALSRAIFERDTLPMVQAPEKFEAIGIKVVKIEFPVVEVDLAWRSKGVDVRLHIDAENYDYLPVKGWWVCNDGTPLKRGQGSIPNGSGFQVSGNPHGVDRSWFCFLGWSEYHDHQGHQQMSWARIRNMGQYRLPTIIMQLYTDLNNGRVQSA